MKDKKFIFVFLIIFSILSLFATVAIGPVYVPIKECISIISDPVFKIGNFSPPQATIIRQIRVPRVLMGYFVGLSLGIAGGVMQGLFLNPLASPYILGIASGASAGAAAAISFNLRQLFGPVALPGGAFLGSLLVVLIVYKLAKVREGRTSIYTLILTGVALGAFFSALTSLLIFLASAEGVREIVFWTLGGLGRSEWAYFYILLPVVALCGLLIVIFSRDLNVLALGEEKASYLGIETETVKKILLFAATLLTSTSIAFTGTIGFVGLITPHAVRLFTGPDHRFLLPATALVGGLFLLWTDAAARTIVQPIELPVGIITAFFGAPFFLYLLRTRRSGEMG